VYGGYFEVGEIESRKFLYKIANPPNSPVSAYEFYHRCMKGNYSLARNGFIEKWDKEKYRAHNKLREVGLGGRVVGGGTGSEHHLRHSKNMMRGTEGEKI